LVFLQIIFGIFVVLSGVQVALGSIHQILGTLVLVGTTAYSLKIFKS
jgi:heme A synthase